MITEKSVSAYKTISEVSKLIDVPSHVLRFWETKFSQVKPIKRSGGRRYYRTEDVKILSSIRKLLYQEDLFANGNWKRHCPKLYKNYSFQPCKNAEKIQKQLLQFPLNFKDMRSAQKSILALKKTIKYYE